MKNYTNETLFYSENSFQQIVKTFEKLKSHIIVPYILVGSLANRVIFPDYFSRPGQKRQSKLSGTHYIAYVWHFSALSVSTSFE